MNANGVLRPKDEYIRQSQTLPPDPNLKASLHDPYKDAASTLASVYGLGEAMREVGSDITDRAFKDVLEANGGRLNPRDISVLFKNLRTALQEHADHGSASKAELALLEAMRGTRLPQSRLERARDRLGSVAAYLAGLEQHPDAHDSDTDMFTAGFLDQGVETIETPHYQQPISVLSPDIARLVAAGRLSREDAEALFLAPTPPQKPQDMSGLTGGQQPIGVNFAVPKPRATGQQPAAIMAMPAPPHRSRGKHAAPGRISSALKSWGQRARNWYQGLTDTENLLQY